MGAEFRYGVEVGRDVTLAELREQGFKAFYVAIGCQGGRLARRCPDEDAEGRLDRGRRLPAPSCADAASGY